MKKALITAAALVALATALGTGVASATPAPHVVGAFQNTNGDYPVSGGYILYSNGKVNAVDGAPFYGDARLSGRENFAVMAQSNNNDGYWLVTSTGQVYTYGGINSECAGDTISEPQVVGPIFGTLDLSQAQQNNSNIDDGFQMVNAAGTVYTYACVESL